jgi:hypothetical protein
MPLTTNTQRESLPDVMTFRKKWRVYQSRLLDHLDGYLQNNRLHLVAAPGSGKTVLGLEVIRRVNQPTLVLAPTITIRDQWVDRLVDLFLPPGSGRPAWVSTELRSPAFLTVATYQALHAVCSGEPEDSPNPWSLFREDYFAVPDALARKKEFAEMFTQNTVPSPFLSAYTRNSPSCWSIEPSCRNARFLRGRRPPVMPSIGSRDVACAEWSNIRRFEHLL